LIQVKDAPGGIGAPAPTGGRRSAATDECPPAAFRRATPPPTKGPWRTWRALLPPTAASRARGPLRLRSRNGRHCL